MTSINLKVNEKEIPLNEQMQTMLQNILLGYINSTKKIPEDIKKIYVEIEF